MISSGDVGGAGWDEVSLPAAPGWSFALRDCAIYKDADYRAQRHRLAVRGAAFSKGNDRFVQALVEQYASGWSGRALDDVRAVVKACGRYEGAKALTSHAIVRKPANEVLLVRSTEVRADAEPTEWWTGVVRRGDLVATVTGRGLTDDEVRRIAARAAAKLR